MVSNDPIDYPAKLRAAVAALQKQQEKIAALEARQHEPIAIIGMGCRFPGGADDPDAFWHRLLDGVDAIREVPAARWPVDAFYDENADAPGTMSTRWGGFLDDVDRFDARFFRISPREAVSMDPQQRVLLEVSWHALEHAGLDPARLNGSDTSVFVGLTALDYAKVLYRDDVSRIDTYGATGNVANVASGRLSYFYGFRGASVTVDTACSSSLVAIHLACQSLRTGDASMALAGGVNLMLAPDNSVAVSRAHMLAPDGRCKTFDRAANGYARSEGCGVLVLKRLSAAQADGDRVIAVIRGTAVRQDGARSGLTVPNGPAQERVIRAGLEAARVQAGEVGYIEAHGTGTSLGDPIEAEAIAHVFQPGRPKSKPLVIGALKTNVGHMESAAGVGGVIKAALSVAHGQIPRHLHLTHVHPDIAFDEIPAIVPAKTMAWPAGYDRRIAGVSSFGSSGTIAHVVVEAPPAEAPASPAAAVRPAVLPLSAMSRGSLTALCDRYDAWLGAADARVDDIAATAALGRAHLWQRVAVVGRSTTEWRAALAARRLAPAAERRGAIVFVAADDDQLDDAAAAVLAEALPGYRAAIEACEAARAERALVTAPALARFARQFALASAWRACGIVPAAVVGHGLGALVADAIAGVLTLPAAMAAAATSSDSAVSRASGTIARTLDGVQGACTALALGAASDALNALAAEGAAWLSLGDRTGDVATAALAVVAALYERGADIDWSALCRQGAASLPRRVALPLYPFERERFWPEQPAAARAPKSVAAAIARTAAPVAAMPTPPDDGRMRFGIFFFNGSETEPRSENYRLLFDATKFADTHGFSSVWLPERHFTKFGSLYPNPATVHAALARETTQIRLMAGSVVMPLHHPLRLAEEWSVVDNLSNGRAGMSFAAGWNPDDFSLNPANYADRSEALFRGIEDVRRLWRGEAITVTSGTGAPTSVRAYPTPVQRELPLWVTAAGSPRTFERAGAIGANLLTHLLDHDVDELAEKIRLYRQARADHGHDPAAGQVTVMLHTFIGRDIESVHAAVRAPYCRYLKENVHLLKGLAVHRGSQMDLSTLSEADLDGFVGFLYERFFSTRALLGTVDSCAPLVARLRAAGVNEIGCLLDFGPDTDAVLASLPALAELVAHASQLEVASSSTAMSANAAGAPDLLSHAYGMQWTPVATPEPAAARRGRRVAVVADRGGVGAALVDALRRAQLSPVLVAADQALPDVDECVYAPLLDRGPVEDVTASLADVVAWYQRAVTARPSMKVWWLTRGGQVAVERDVPAPLHAAAWAMLKVLPIERAQSWGGLIDLETGATASDVARVIAALLAGEPGADQIAVRGDACMAARLMPIAVPAPSAPVTLPGDASILVTGGLRGLGLESARWLAARGARHVLLAGRSAPEAATDTVVRELSSRGVNVRVVTLDVTDADAVARVAQEEVAAGRPPVRGVVHAAGVWEDQPLATLTSAALARVLAPKVAGTLALTRALPDLDVFIAFSAFSALLPAETQGNYAAANAFLDAYVSAARARAPKAWVSVHWGPWAGVGFAQTDYGRRAHERLQGLGISRITAPHGFEALDALMAGGYSGIGLMPVDWRRLFERDPNARLSPMLRELSQRYAVMATSEAGRVRELLSGLTGAEATARLEQELTSMAAGIMQLPESAIDRQVSFTDLGLDSLMAVELKNRIRHDVGVDVPLVKLLSGPSIAELTLLVSVHRKMADLGGAVPQGDDVAEIEI